jgi:SAM-dependent methyltransferase
MKKLTTKSNFVEAFSQKGKLIEISNLNKYVNNKKERYFVHKNTGLVINKRLKSYKFTADKYSELAFKSKFTNSTYSAKIPAVNARLNYVISTLNNLKKIKNKSLLDVGAGTGEFLIMAKALGAKVFGVEPKLENCKEMKRKKIKCLAGPIEYYKSQKKYDFVSVLWTFCNMYDPLNALMGIKKFLKNNGIIVVADSSRILVHPRKSLKNWVGNMPRYLNPYHFSCNSMKSLLMLCGFEIIFENRFYDTDYLVVVAKKTNKIFKKYPIDDYKKIIEFFKTWEKIDKRIK